MKWVVGLAHVRLVKRAFFVEVTSTDKAFVTLRATTFPVDACQCSPSRGPELPR